LVFQGDAAEIYLGEMQMRYNQALLVQEIGQVCSTVFDIRELTEKVMEVLEKRLNFDRGMILLLDGEKRPAIRRLWFQQSEETCRTGNGLD
jgi:hypothetical protein